MINLASSEIASSLGLEHKFSFSRDLKAPLVLLVHGRAGTLDVMWTFRRCLPEGCNIIAPQALLADSIGGYSWWSMTNPSDKVALEKGVELAYDKLKLFISSSIQFYNLQPSKILALGFSQGGVLLSAYLQKQPQFFAGVALLASFVSRLKAVDYERIIAIPEQSKTRIFMAHGVEDQTVTIEAAYKGRDHLKSLGFEVAFVEDPVGHKVGRQGMRALTAWSQAAISL